MSTICPIRNVLDQATLLPVISEMLLIHWSAAFGGIITTRTCLVRRKPHSGPRPIHHCGCLSVDSVVTSSTTSLSTEALKRPPARSSQRVGVLDHSIDVLLLAPVLRLKREWSLALSLALTCAFACCWLCSFLLFSGIIQTVHFTQTVCFSWSCVRSTASLRFRTLFAAPPHALPRAARGLVVFSTTHSPPPRAARVEDVFPELVCSGSLLLSKQLLDSLECSPHLTIALDSTGNDRQHRQVW